MNLDLIHVHVVNSLHFGHSYWQSRNPYREGEREGGGRERSRGKGGRERRGAIGLLVYGEF